MKKYELQKLNSTSTADLLPHIYKNYRLKKRKDVYELERLISQQKGMELSREISLTFHVFFSRSVARFVASWLRLD